MALTDVMTDFKRNINFAGLMKWGVLYSLLFLFFGGSERPQASHNVRFLPDSFSVDVDKSTSKKLSDLDVFSLHKVFGDLEVEIEDNDDHHYSHPKSSPGPSLLLVLEERIDISFFPRKIIKLFILFHSWKSFPSI